jgi:hypothetical protein
MASEYQVLIGGFSHLSERVFRFQHSPFTPQMVPNAAESVYFADPCALIK